MLNDLRFSIRQLVKSPGFTFIAAITLALGIGANTAIFSLINELLIKPLPYSESNRIVQIQQDTKQGPYSYMPYSGGLFLDIEDTATQFEALSYVHNGSLNLTDAGDPLRINGLEVSTSYLSILGIEPTLGSDFSPESEKPGGDKRVVLISDSLWKTQFASDPTIVNKSITLDYEGYTILGILPPTTFLVEGIDFIIPAAIRIDEWKQPKTYDYLGTIIGRLKPNASIQSATNELETIKANSISGYPEMMKEWGVKIQTLQEATFGDYKRYIITLFVAVGMVLLVACANVANLLLARATARQGEMSVRSALGGSTWKIVRQLLIESTLLALLGGIFGLVLAIISLKPLALVVGLNELPNTNLELDPRVLLFSLSISLATGIIFGIFPAFKALRGNVNTGLKDSTRSATSAMGNKVQSALIVAEVALTVVLLVSIGLLLKSFTNAFKADPGFRGESVLTFEVKRSTIRSPEMADLVRFTEQILESIEQIPGVDSAAMVSSTPMNIEKAYGGPLWRDDQPDKANAYFGGFDSVNGDFFKVVGIPLLSGRKFEKTDQNANAPKVIIVNDRLVQDLYPDEDPIGRFINHAGHLWEIVGVVGSVSQFVLGTERRPTVYKPQAHWPWDTSYVVKTNIPPLLLAEQVRNAVLSVDSQQPIDKLRSLDETVKETLEGRVIMVSLIGLFGVISIFLAAIGIYGLMAYLVEQRNREIGIRLAIGAVPSEVVQMIFKRGLTLSAMGIVIGVATVIALGRPLAFILYQVQPYDPIILFTVSFITLSITAFACWRPALIASKISPSVALRMQ